MQLTEVVNVHPKFLITWAKTVIYRQTVQHGQYILDQQPCFEPKLARMYAFWIMSIWIVRIFVTENYEHFIEQTADVFCLHLEQLINTY